MKRRQRGSGTIERVEKALGDGSTKVYFRPRLTTPEKRKSLGLVRSIEEADVMLEAARAEIFSSDDAPRLTLRAWGLRFLDRREREGYRSVDDDRNRWRQHTCAAALVSGMWGRRWSLEEVKALLGHESITTTERYAHLAQSALKTAAAETSGPLDKPT